MKVFLGMIRFNIKVLILVGLFFMGGLLYFFNSLYFQERYLGSQIISYKSIEQIKSTHTEYSGKIDLYFNGKNIPYSNSDNFYLLHIENENDYKKIYTKSDYKIRIINIENNYSMNLFLYNDKYYKEVKLNITNIPVINIDYNKQINFYGFGFDISGLKCNYTIRGDSSQNSLKKSYKLSLKNQKDQDLSLPLLNMRSNNTWVLNSIFFDNSYMREKISYDIWNALSSDFNHTIEYIELVINNNYQGLYYLVETVNMDTFNGNKQDDLLVSVKSWGTALESLGIDEQLEANSEVIDEFEIESGLEEYPETQSDILDSYRLLILDEKSIIEIKYDIENIINYQLFLNFTMARDNTYKNQKVLFRNMNSYYLVQKTVWDIDWTFNNENIYRFNNKLNVDINDVDIDLGIPKSLRNDELYLRLIKNKYYEFKENYFNEKNLFEIIEKYRKYLELYGAVNRDMEKWDNKDYLESINILEKFINQRIKVLDKYYGGL